MALNDKQLFGDAISSRKTSLICSTRTSLRRSASTISTLFELIWVPPPPSNWETTLCCGSSMARIAGIFVGSSVTR